MIPIIIKCDKSQTLPHISFKTINFHIKVKVVMLLVFSTNLKVPFSQYHGNYISLNKLKIRTMPECPLSILLLSEMILGTDIIYTWGNTEVQICKYVYTRPVSLQNKSHYKNCRQCLIWGQWGMQHFSNCFLSPKPKIQNSNENFQELHFLKLFNVINPGRN